MNIFKSRKFRQGSIATVMTVLGVVLAVVLTMVLTLMSARFGWTLDLTTNKVFEITAETKDFVAGLTKDVNIYVLNSEEVFLANAPQAYMVQANEVIKKYEGLSPRVSLRYVDIVRTPTFTAQYGDLNLQSNQILLECPETGRTTVVNYLDLFNVTTDQYGQSSVRSSKAEQSMTSAILNVTSDKKILVTVLGGHNETDISAFTTLLEANNYEIVSQNLLTEESVNPDAAIAILCAPARDLTEDELRKLDAFLYNDERLGKTLFYLTSGDAPDSSSYPNLSAWLQEWGVAVGDGVVFESNTSYMLSPTDPLVALADYAEEEYSAEVRAKDLYPAILYSKPLSEIYSVDTEGNRSKGGRTSKTLLQFSSRSGVMTEEITSWPPTEQFMTGPVPTVILTSEVKYDSFTPRYSHVLVSGSYYSFDTQILGGASYANSEYFLGLMDSLAGREDTIKIQDKTISVESMEMTVSQMNVISISMFIVLPLALLVSGIVIWARRRHR